MEFPKDDGTPRYGVHAVDVSDGRDAADFAVLHLQGPVPAHVGVAPLGFPRPAALAGQDWWAFGFPNDDPRGQSAHGTVGTDLGYGYVRLDTESRSPIELGFSGGAVWSAKLGAVVALVSHAEERTGLGQALTLHQADLSLPGARLRALEGSSWDWTLQRDPQYAEHWSPRARGITAGNDRVNRFRGRGAALTEIRDWLDRTRPDYQAMVVTGSPGVGKSAVLSRIVTTADATARAELPADDGGVRATEGSVMCAVHAKGKTAMEVAAEIAHAARADVPEQPYGLAPAIRTRLEHREARFNVVIDAVDEATTPREAKDIVRQVVIPLLQQCADVGVQVIAGFRRQVGDVGLLYEFGARGATVVDLDEERYFALEDLEDYALATLQLRGAERRPSPYADERAARPVARRIAYIAKRNFLIAGLTALTRGLYDDVPVAPEALIFDRDVGSALADFLKLVPGLPEISATDLLTAVAFAEAPGLPLELWRVAVKAMFEVEVSTRSLRIFARQSAVNFLIESIARDTDSVFRLFHEALNEALLSDRAQTFRRVEDEREIARAFLDYGRGVGWENAPRYLLRSLGHHAAQAGLIDELLVDDEYLLHADLSRLTVFSGAAETAVGRDRSLLLSRTPYAATVDLATADPATVDPPTRRALFSVTEALEKLGDRFRTGDGPAPYRARWASTTTHRERAAQEGHTGGVLTILALAVDGRTQMASAAEDEMVRLWDPVTGAQIQVLEGHAGVVNFLAAFTAEDGSARLLSGGSDALIRIWNPANGEQIRVLEGHAGPVFALDTFVAEDGRTLVVSGGADTVIRIWDPATGRDERPPLIGGGGSIRAVCALPVDGRVLLAVCAMDGLHLWDPVTGQKHGEFADAGEMLWTATSFAAADGGIRLAAAGNDTIGIWDPVSGRRIRVLEGHSGPIWHVCAFTAADGRVALASACDDESVRIWDPETGESGQHSVDDMAGGANCVCAFTLDGRTLIAAGGGTTLRVWDSVSGERRPALRSGQSTSWTLAVFADAGGDILIASGVGPTIQIWHSRAGRRLAELGGEGGPIHAVCAYTGPDGRALLATGEDDGMLRIWDPAEARPVTGLEDGSSPQWSVVAVVMNDGRTLLATGGSDGVVTLWDPTDGVLRHRLRGHSGPVWDMCTVEVDDRVLLVSAGNDGMLILWDPAAGTRLRTIDAHVGGAWTVCGITLADGRSVLASGGSEGPVRVWDPESGTLLRALEGHSSGIWGVSGFTSARGEALLVSTCDAAEVRIWDPATGRLRAVIPVHLMPAAVADADGLLVVHTSAGLLVIELDEALLNVSSR